MSIYIINILFTGIISVIATNSMYTKRTQISKKKISLLACMLILGVWVFINAARDISVGTDTNGYYYFYNQLVNKDISWLDYVSEGDWLFETFRYVCAHLLKLEWKNFVAFIAIITYLPVLLSMRKNNAEYFSISALMYIFSLNYYNSFNAMRQTAAVSFSFYAYNELLVNKKYVRYAIVMILAIGLHSTALFALPMHFFSFVKIKSILFWGIISGLIVSMFAFDSVWSIAINTLNSVGNTALVGRYENALNYYSGSGYLRIFVLLAPLLLCAFKYKILEEKYPKIDRDIVFVVLAAVLMLFSTRNWLFARLASYSSIFIISLVPKLGCIFKEDSRKLAMILISLLYFIYMIALLLHGESGLYPYSFYRA